jgi:hypothetical protein
MQHELYRVQISEVLLYFHTHLLNYTYENIPNTQDMSDQEPTNQKAN